MKEMIGYGNFCFLIRYPLNASKFLDSANPLIQSHFFEGKKNELKKLKNENMLELMKFFETRDNLNSVLAGYVSKTVERLICSYDYILLNFFKNNETIMDNIIYHCYNQSVIDKILKNLIFKSEDEDAKPQVALEIKLESRKIQINNFPMKLKILNKLQDKLKNTDNNYIRQNILNVFHNMIVVEGKNEELCKLIQQFFYIKENIIIFFNCALETNNNLVFEKITIILSLLFSNYSQVANRNNSEEYNITLNNSDLFHCFLDYLDKLKQILEVF